MISSRIWSRPSPDSTHYGLAAWPDGRARSMPAEAIMTLEALGDTETWVGATAKQIARAGRPGGAAAVRRGDASATEVVADPLAHITARESVVRAFRLLRAGEALAEADAVDAQEELANLPLAGVPVAVKENKIGRASCRE